MSGVIAVIPARGGSKGLERKNLLPLAGKPLLVWTIEAARASRLVDRIVVSTDDEVIADLARTSHADAPFIRPAHFASDAATSEDVLQHTIAWLEEHEQVSYDILVYLQATDPFRRAGIIDKVVETLMANPELDSVFAAKPEHKNYWTVVDGRHVPLGRHSHQPRQEKPPVFREDTGVALATRVSVIKQGRRIGDRVSIISHQHDGDFIDIHSPLDLWIANQLVERRGINPNG